MDQEKLLSDIMNVPVNDLNATQISAQVDDCLPLLLDNEETNETIQTNSNNLEGSSDASSVVKSDSPVNNTSKMKKNRPTKKKRISEKK
jgi:hypothetical protein